jgi:hypothetical protein
VGTLGVGIVDLNAHSWENPPSRPDLINLLESADSEYYSGIDHSKARSDLRVLDLSKPLPHKYGFYTAEGSVGILEITGTTNRVEFRYKLVEAGKGGSSTTAAPTIPDPERAVVLFNEIEDLGHEFDAAFASTNLAAAQTGTRRLIRLLTEFNVAVRGTDLEFPENLIGDVDKVRQALDEGDWERAKKASAHNEEYARVFKRISTRMVEIARERETRKPR